MPANNLMRGSPVKGFSDNKRHSFHRSGRVFSGRRGFFIYTANSFIRSKSCD
ncbi:cytoplasmic protein [Escherichia coli]|nr:cytoplasmic protein [Escherichia coli]HAJ3343691.1 cytoplasmic protein [Escherichia coli]